MFTHAILNKTASRQRNKSHTRRYNLSGKSGSTHGHTTTCNFSIKRERSSHHQSSKIKDTCVDPDLPFIPRKTRATRGRGGKIVSRSKKIREWKERKSIYIAPLYSVYSQTAQTQFYLQITPCLLFLRKRSPDGASTECSGERRIAAHYSFIDP